MVQTFKRGIGINYKVLDKKLNKFKFCFKIND